MSNLNLLPPDEKLALSYVMKARMVAAVGSGLAAILAIFITLLLPTFFLLVFQKSELLRSLRIETEGQAKTAIPETVARIKEINRLADAVARHEDGTELLFPLFASVLRDLPPAVRLHTLKFRSESRELAVGGFSPNRTSLLALLKALEQNPRLEAVSSPVANLIKETDITFSIAAKVKAK